MSPFGGSTAFSGSHAQTDALLGSFGLLPTRLGRVLFVDSVHGQGSNSGNAPDEALALVDQAINKCTAGKGDVIFCMPGHAETVTATSIALDIAGVTIVGLGSGLARPAFTYGAAAATITVSAANCRWTGCHFIGNFLDVAAAFTLGAAKDFRLDNNTFRDNSAVLGFLSIVVTGSTANAADGLRVERNHWFSLDVSPNAFISVLGNLDYLLVTDNEADMAATNDVGHFITIAAFVLRGARILRNICNVVSATTATAGLFMTGSSTTNTGVLAYNFVSSLDVTTPLFNTAGMGLRLLENRYVGTADNQGKLLPIAMA